jgi:SAM-dependent methyltransferase
VLDVLQGVATSLAADTGRPCLDIVDAGGGTGGFAVPLAGLGHSVTVIDPSPDSLAAAQRRAAEQNVPLRAVQGEAADLATLAGEQSADLVLCHSVLEYVDSPPAAMAASRQSCGAGRSACSPQRGGRGYPPRPGGPVRRGAAVAHRHRPRGGRQRQRQPFRDLDGRQGRDGGGRAQSKRQPAGSPGRRHQPDRAGGLAGGG